VRANSPTVAIFARIGFGQWFRDFTDTMQIAGGSLVLIPQTFADGILMIGCTLVGAMVFFSAKRSPQSSGRSAYGTSLCRR